jgi:hypothetical protein
VTGRPTARQVPGNERGSPPAVAREVTQDRLALLHGLVCGVASVLPETAEREGMPILAPHSVRMQGVCRDDSTRHPSAQLSQGSGTGQLGPFDPGRDDPGCEPVSE